jgi:hypothetical protein
MKTKTWAWFAGLGVGIGMAACSFVSCAQPTVECQVGLNAPYVGVLTIQGTAPACAAANPALLQKGDTFGMEFYNPPTPSSVIVDGGLSTGTYDPSIVTMAVVSDTMDQQQIIYSDQQYPDGQIPGSMGAPSDPVFFNDGIAGHAPYATGTFASSSPDSNNICHVPTLKPALEDFAYMDGGALDDAGAPALPTTNFEDNWSDLQFYVTPAVQGDQFTGNLSRTIEGCTVNYKVVGLWPAINCTLYDPNTGDLILDANGNPQPSLLECSPCATPDAGLATGSGINPNFPIACTALYDNTDPFGRGAAPFFCTLTGQGTATGSSDLPQLNTDEPACAISH